MPDEAQPMKHERPRALRPDELPRRIDAQAAQDRRIFDGSPGAPAAPERSLSTDLKGQHLSGDLAIGAGGVAGRS